jgi:hypothetical protein
MVERDPFRAMAGSRRASRVDRAAQFMPFAALRGYYDLCRERERVVEPKHELTEEEAEALSASLSHLRRREMASVTYYEGDGYVTVRGMVSDIDEAGRVLTIVRTHIPLDDILRIELG